MGIINTRTGEVVARDARIVRSLAGQARGLMFSRKKNLVFDMGRPRRVLLHMFFVFFPIDVLYLDSSCRVVEAARLTPFSWYSPKSSAHYVVELAKRTGKLPGTGDRLRFSKDLYTRL